MTKRKAHSLATMAACLLIALSMQTYVNAGSTRPTSLQEATDISATTDKSITAAGFSTAGNATAATFIGDGSGLTGVTATDATRVLKAGDTMTGALIVNNDITATGTVSAVNGIFTTATSTATIPVSASSSGSGNSVVGLNYGSGKAGYFYINNALNMEPALMGITTGTGPALNGIASGEGPYANALSVSSDASNTAPMIYGLHSGSGNLLEIESSTATVTIDNSGAITATSMDLSGRATATYFIGDGSLLTGIAAGTGDFMADGSVPMTGAYTSGVFGTSGYDFTQNGYAPGYAGKMFWDSSKMAFRAGYVSGNTWDDANVGAFSVGMGTNPKASAQDSVAIGNATVASQQNAFALGNNAQSSGASSFAIGQYTRATANYSIMLGGTTSGLPITNSTANSLMVGFNSNTPTMFVSGGSGSTGTFGQVGIGTVAPIAGSLIDINGVLNSASITSEGTIAATGTISSVAGFIASGTPGIDKTTTTCCTYDGSMVCTATGTVTVIKGLITALCP